MALLLEAVCSDHHRRRLSVSFVPLEEMIEHMNAHCTKRDPLFLWSLFNHNFRRIDEMRHKRYDNRSTGARTRGRGSSEPPLLTPPADRRVPQRDSLPGWVPPLSEA